MKIKTEEEIQKDLEQVMKDTSIASGEACMIYICELIKYHYEGDFSASSIVDFIEKEFYKQVSNENGEESE